MADNKRRYILYGVILAAISIMLAACAGQSPASAPTTGPVATSAPVPTSPPSLASSPPVVEVPTATSGETLDSTRLPATVVAYDAAPAPAPSSTPTIVRVATPTAAPAPAPSATPATTPEPAPDPASTVEASPQKSEIGRHGLGADDAPVTVVEVSDFG